MPFHSVTQANLVIVRSAGFVLDDIKAIMSLLRRASQQAARPLDWIIISPQAVRPPDGAVRGEIMRCMDEVLQLCQAVHLVLEGTSFLVSFKRSVLTGMLLATRSRGRFFVHTSLAEALQRIAPQNAQLQEDLSSRVAAL